MVINLYYYNEVRIVNNSFLNLVIKIGCLECDNGHIQVIVNIT